MLPNDEQLQISDAARQFAQERLKPFAAEWDREHRFPKEAIAEMAEMGFFGMLVPEQWGGCDTGYLAYAMALEEVAAGDGACSTIMSVHNSVGCVPILTFGNDAQKERFLTPLASGAMLGAFALTEPQGRLRRQQPEHPGPSGRRSLRAQWLQAVHHLRAERRGGDCVRGDRPECRQARHQRLYRAHRLTGLQRGPGRGQARPACVRHLPDPFSRPAGAGRQSSGRGGRRLQDRPGQP